MVQTLFEWGILVTLVELGSFLHLTDLCIFTQPQTGKDMGPSPVGLSIPNGFPQHPLSLLIKQLPLLILSVGILKRCSFAGAHLYAIED